MHFLIERAVRKPHQNRPTLPKGARYDVAVGAWLAESGEPLTSSKTGPKPVTKKADQETGEDQKGE